MNRISRITSADWAPHIENMARKVAPVVAAVITAGVMTYEAGKLVRIAIEELNDFLAAALAKATGVSNAQHQERLDEWLLGACLALALAWEWLTIAAEPTNSSAAVLAPPPVRSTPKPKAKPLERGSRRG